MDIPISYRNKEKEKQKEERSNVYLFFGNVSEMSNDLLINRKKNELGSCRFFGCHGTHCMDLYRAFCKPCAFGVEPFCSFASCLYIFALAGHVSRKGMKE